MKHQTVMTLPSQTKNTIHMLAHLFKRRNHFLRTNNLLLMITYMMQSLQYVWWLLHWNVHLLHWLQILLSLITRIWMWLIWYIPVSQQVFKSIMTREAIDHVVILFVTIIQIYNMSVLTDGLIQNYTVQLLFYVCPFLYQYLILNFYSKNYQYTLFLNSHYNSFYLTSLWTPNVMLS